MILIETMNIEYLPVIQLAPAARTACIRVHFREIFDCIVNCYEDGTTGYCQANQKTEMKSGVSRLDVITIIISIPQTSLQKSILMLILAWVRLC